MLTWLGIEHSNVDLTRLWTFECFPGKELDIRMLTWLDIGHFNVDLAMRGTFEC